MTPANCPTRDPVPRPVFPSRELIAKEAALVSCSQEKGPWDTGALRAGAW